MHAVAQPAGLAEHLDRWVQTHTLSPIQVDCVTAVMLKILDGKCKMRGSEKLVMAALYERVKHLPGQHLGSETHVLITMAHGTPGRSWVDEVYERRVLAETMISRPIMKTFKAMIRERGLFPAALAPEGEGSLAEPED
jgi:hypothetical protein